MLANNKEIVPVAKDVFSTKCSQAICIRSKTGAAHPRQISEQYDGVCR